MKRLAPIGIILFALFISLVSCEKDDTSPKKQITDKDSVYLFINELMHYWYYWNTQITDIDYLNFEEPQLLMDALKVTQDKWSFIDKKQTIIQRFTEGKEFGYGFYVGWDNLNNLRVIMCYNNSNAYAQGVRKGWIVEEIDGIPVQSISSFTKYFNDEPLNASFKFRNDLNSTVSFNFGKESYILNGVFEPAIYNHASKKVGYIAYQSFLGYSKQELQTELTNFKSIGIDELIVDLRYNSGGYVNLAQYLADAISPANKIGEIFFKTRHNSNRAAKNDTTVYLQANDQNLNLNRVFFITNKYSASASELVINGLDPHMEVLQIGGVTSGKPYSMYGFTFQDWLAYPVCAKSVNADGFGDYENGLIPDQLTTDNHAYNWGDNNDPLIKQALNYIEFGAFGDLALDYKSTRETEIIDINGKFSQNLMLLDK